MSQEKPIQQDKNPQPFTDVDFNGLPENTIILKKNANGEYDEVEKGTNTYLPNTFYKKQEQDLALSPSTEESTTVNNPLVKEGTEVALVKEGTEVALVKEGAKVARKILAELQQDELAASTANLAASTANLAASTANPTASTTTPPALTTDSAAAAAGGRSRTKRKKSHKKGKSSKKVAKRRKSNSSRRRRSSRKQNKH
jgi:hypothetical protein